MGEVVLDVRVHGDPAPQGSKKHVGGGRMVESSARVQPWRDSIVAAIMTSASGPPPKAYGPVSVTLVFWIQRPRSHYGTGRNAGMLRASAPRFPSVKPDLDKLERSTLDALVTAAVIHDDAQVTICGASKLYADERGTGADILVWEVT